MNQIDEFVRLWKQLIRMRMEEYRGDYKHFKKELKDLPEIMAWPHVAAIGGFKHITRGKGKPDDPLFCLFVGWIGGVVKIFTKQMTRAL